ncbi:hypothetical protein [Agathobaculum sp. Marseille-P7918]|uniref:hypothetical protein n=1 Tax=Agathobaculum sp. Marseille-P7918 TaxID=2479843 RepID=UPI0013DD9BD6|nr:hypothetical protein [Agathobaculum sp. Marseille-P7918]
MDTNMTFRIDSQTKARMTEICNQFIMTPATEITREQMRADTADILDDYAQDYKKMSE